MVMDEDTQGKYEFKAEDSYLKNAGLLKFAGFGFLLDGRALVDP